MFRILLSLLCVSVFAVACLKNQGDTGCPYQPRNTVAPQSEQDALATYIDTNHIDAVKHPSGFYYTIVKPGTGTDSMGLCSQIRIKYRGTLISGAEFDKQESANFILGMLIDAWRSGLPLIKKGGEMKLYVPPTLGYGPDEKKNQQGQVVIPANSVLIFDVTLIDYTPAN